jgi:hypothetical protein
MYVYMCVCISGCVSLILAHPVSVSVWHADGPVDGAADGAGAAADMLEDEGAAAPAVADPQDDDAPVDPDAYVPVALTWAGPH